MALPKLVNLAQMYTYTTGTGPVVLAGATPGYRTFIAAGVVSGDTVRYAIYEANRREYGYGVVSIAGTTVSMTRVYQGSTTGALLDLQGSAIVSVSPTADDFAQINAPSDIVAYGAIAGGLTDATPSIIAMAAARGFVTIPAGNFRIATVTTISVPVQFDIGAYITVDAGVTVAFASRVDSIRQWIFRGPGNISFTGDDSREICVSWFGAVSENYGHDMSPYFNAAYASMGNLRESIVLLDGTLYTLHSTVTVTRGAYTKGIGTRRTVFNLSSFSGVDVFATSGEGCRFEGLQFENNGATGVVTGAVINAQHQYTIFEDIGVQNVPVGLRLGGKGCRAHHIQDINTAGTAATGSCLISIENVDCSVDDVYQVGSTGPESLVHVGATTTSSGNFSVTNVESSSPSIGVLVRSGNQYCARGYINNVRAHGSGSAAVQIENTAGNTLQNIIIDGVDVAASMTNGVVVNVTAGTVSNLLIQNVVTLGIAGRGISLTRTAGTLDDVRIGLCNLDAAATPIYRSGTMTNVTFDMQTLVPRPNPSRCWHATILDDTAVAINYGAHIYSGFLIVTGATTNYGMFVIRAATTPGITNISVSANVNSATGVLTGTTGTDGRITVSVDALGMIYVENRLGFSLTTEIILSTGIEP